MSTPTLKWRDERAGAKVADLKRTVGEMVKVAKQVKDKNGDGEVQASELAAAAKPKGQRFAKTMEDVRSGSGFWARDALPGGNPNFSHDEFVDDYKHLAEQFERLDGDGNGKLDATELKGANSRMSRSVIDYTAGE